MSSPLTPQQVSAINEYLDGQYDTYKQLGEQLFEAFRADQSGKDNISAQVRNLQQIAVSAGSLSEVEDFIKNQMGRERGNERKWRSVGGPLLESLTVLRQVAPESHFGREGKAPDAGDQLGIRLRLVRGWVRSVVASYLYAKAQAEVARV